MGRGGKKKKYRRTRGGGGDRDREYQRWNLNDRASLVCYLDAYRSGCVEHHQRRRSRSKKKRRRIYNDREYVHAKQQQQQQADEGLLLNMIGNVELPAITPCVLGQPYLALPLILTPKQRRMVHECCVETDLFHYTFEVDEDTNTIDNNNQNNRYVVISIYADGFQELLLLSRSSGSLTSSCNNNDDGDDDDDDVDSTPHDDENKMKTALPVYKYKPWYYAERNSSNKKTAGMEYEKRSRKMIDALLDQPTQCLRENLDGIDYDKLENCDLSDIDPPKRTDEKWVLVDTATAMRACIADLYQNKPTEIAFDLECYNKSKYAQLTCLLQIALSNGQEYIIDTLAPGVWDEVQKLQPFFADRSIVKIGHSIGSLDVRSLHRDFGIFCVNVFDTYEASKVLRMPCGYGLAAVSRHYNARDSNHYKELKTKYQACDWTVRPLTDNMIEYGRHDIHYLIRLRELMIRDLTRRELCDMTNAEQKEESELVAQSLAVSLQQFSQFEEEEDGDICLDQPEASLDNETFQSTEELLVVAEPPSAPAALTTASKSRGVNDDDYFPPTTSFDREMRSIPAEEEEEQQQQQQQGGEASNVTTSKTSLEEEEPQQQTKADVSTLRLQPRLMTVLTYSQQRCTALWSGVDSNPLKNPTFTSLLKRAKRGQIQWSNKQTQLYLDLVQWRTKTAHEIGSLADFVAGNDFLVNMAWKQVASIEALRRITFDLPDALEDNPDFVKHLLGIVNSSIMGMERTVDDDDGEILLLPTAAEIYWYYSEERNLMTSNQNDDEDSSSGLLWKVALTATVAVAGVTCIVLTQRRARTRS